MPSAVPNALLSDVIGRVYDCAIDPNRWEDALSHVYPLVHCASASLDLVDLRTGRVLLHVATGIPEEFARSIVDYAADAIEMWGGLDYVMSLPMEDVAVLSWLKSPDYLARSRYFVEWGGPQGLVDTIAIVAARDASSLGTIGLGRHVSAGPVSEDDAATARLIIPHIQRALSISRLLELKAIEFRTLEATLDAVAVGIVLVGRDLRIVHANQAAKKMLDVRDPIASERGILSLRNRAAESGLRLAVALCGEDEALMGRRGQGIPVETATGDPAILQVLPLKHGVLRNNLDLNAAAAIFIAPSGSSLPPPEQALSALFDLTPAEARVFTHAAKGTTTAEIATTLGVNATTIKTHLLRIYRKTETSGQVELMKLASTLTLTV